MLRSVHDTFSSEQTRFLSHEIGLDLFQGVLEGRSFSLPQARSDGSLRFALAQYVKGGQ